MKTKYLDNEIQLLNSIKRNNEISDYGQEKLNEFIAIKEQLTLTDVSQQRELLEAYQHFIDWNEEHDRKADTLQRIDAFIAFNCG